MTDYILTLLSNAKFPLMLGVAFGLLSFSLRKRELWALKFFAFEFVIILVYSTIYTLLLDKGVSAIPSPLFYAAMSLIFCLVFAANVLLVWRSFECSFMQALYVGIIAYSTEHLANALYSMICGAALADFVASGLYSAVQTAIYIATYALVYACVFLLYMKMTADRQYLLRKKRLVIPSMIVLGVTITLSVFSSAYSYGSALYVIERLYSAVSALMLLMVMFGVFETGRLERDNAVMREVEKSKRQQYEFSKQSVDLINIKYHDLKKMIDSRLPDVVSKADLENVLRGISVYDAVAETGNTSLDVVLTEKKLYCDRHGVRFTYIADGGCLSFMDGVDIYSLFGNILDNAIENVMKAPDPEERDISLDIRRVGDMVSVHSENYCVGDVRIVGGLPVTTKENTDEHGFGTRSIRRIAELYGGDATFAKYGSRFTVDLLIPMPEAA